MFTKQHYIKVAKTIKDSLAFNVSYKKDLVNRFCNMFQKDNDLFKRDVFIKACGLEND